jgi:hypothetical protein
MRMPRRIGPALCACALGLCAILPGCNSEGYVTDQSNIETYVKNVTLCGDRYLTVASGGARRSVPLGAVSRIVMANEETKTINGQLYFCASVEFRDGSKLDAKTKSNAPLTFVLVSGSLCGDSQKGHYTISLANVSKLILKGN